MLRKTPKLLDDIRDATAFIRQATQDKTLEGYRVEHRTCRVWNSK